MPYEDTYRSFLACFDGDGECAGLDDADQDPNLIQQYHLIKANI